MVEDPDQVVLGRIVRGLTALIIEFDGPSTALVGGTRYVTLCSGGLKPEGQESPCYGWDEAVELYSEQLRAMIMENAGKQLAWRARPRLECLGPAKFRVWSRLAFI